MAWLSLANRTVSGLERISIFGASLCMVSMMLVVVLDVGMRYVFRAPLSWSYDLVANFLMVGAALLAVSETFRHGGHVAVNLFRSRMSRNVRRWADAASALMVIPVLLPMWASYILVPLGIGLLLLRMMIHFADLVSGGEGHVPDSADHHAHRSAPAAGSRSEEDDR
jgi:TRAP-type C4-dicarboxylate transport system permease small subunit